jgi:hypothetical protein
MSTNLQPAHQDQLAVFSMGVTGGALGPYIVTI